MGKKRKSPEPGEALTARLAPTKNDVYGACYDPVNILGRRVAETCAILARMGATDEELMWCFKRYGNLTLLDISKIELRHRTDNPSRKGE